MNTIDELYAAAVTAAENKDIPTLERVDAINENFSDDEIMRIFWDRIADHSLSVAMMVHKHCPKIVCRIVSIGLRMVEEKNSNARGV